MIDGESRSWVPEFLLLVLLWIYFHRSLDLCVSWFAIPFMLLLSGKCNLLIIVKCSETIAEKVLCESSKWHTANLTSDFLLLFWMTDFNCSGLNSCKHAIAAHWTKVFIPGFPHRCVAVTWPILSLLILLWFILCNRFQQSWIHLLKLIMSSLSIF